MSRSVFVRAGTWMLRFAPDTAVRVVAVFAADLCWLLLRDRRRTVLENLRHSASDRTRAERRRLGRATFRNFARCTIDFLRLPLMRPDQVVGLIDLRGAEHLDRALAHGRGVILLGGHVGNWELAGPLLAALGYRVHAVFEDEAIGAETYQTYEAYRRTTGLKVIPLSRAAASYKVLKQGGLLALLGDRVIGSRAHVVDFCGGRRELPIGPAVLARLSGATVLLASLILNLNPAAPRRYLAVIEPPLARGPDRSDDQSFVEAIAGGLSRTIEAHPDQWFVFQPRWLARDLSDRSASPRETS